MTYFSFTLNPKNPPKTAVLLIHGLFESPYVYRELGNVLYEQGFFVRAICLPGHGTQPEDLLTVSAKAWYDAVESEYLQLKSQYQRIIVAGHSTGGALALKLTLNHTLQGLILLAPAIEIKTPLAKLLHSNKLANFVERLFPFIQRAEEKDLARYHSIPLNAVRQVFALSQELKTLKDKPFPCPAFLISSKEDETISHTKALKDFLAHPSDFHKKILIYTGDKKITRPSNEVTTSSKIQIEYQSSAHPNLGIVHQSHIGLLFSKENEHYGMAGDYFRASHPNPNMIYGAFHQLHEIGFNFLNYFKSKKKQKKTLTFNPNFESMAKAIVDFINMC